MPVVVKDIDTAQGIVSGYFASFGTVDTDLDMFVKGCFKKTIQERGPKSSQPRIKHLLDHDTTKAPGVLQELTEDNTGLYYVSKLALNTTLGRDVLGMYIDGIITEHSNMTQFVKVKAMGDYQEVTEARLWEGSSLQAWGANQYTPVDQVKAKDKVKVVKQTFERMNRLNKAIQKGKYTDETFELLEIEALRIQQYYLDLLEDITKALDTEANDSHSGIEPSAIDTREDVPDDIIKSLQEQILIHENGRH